MSVLDEKAGEAPPPEEPAASAATDDSPEGSAPETGEPSAAEAADATPAPAGEPATQDDDLDFNVAYKAMADRRKNQLHEARGRMQELERLNREYAQNFDSLRQVAPNWIKGAQEAERLRGELAEAQKELAEAREAKAQLALARKTGWEPDEAELEGMRSAQKMSDLERSIQTLTKTLSERHQTPQQPLPQQPAYSPQQPPQQPQYQPQPQYQQPQQPQYQGDAHQQQQATLNYFRGEFARVGREMGLEAQLSRHEQAVLDGWWRGAQQDPTMTVEDAMQDHIALEFEKRKQRARTQRAAVAQVPTAVASGTAGHHGRLGGPSDWNSQVRKPTTDKDRPKGIEKVTEELLRR